MKSDIKLGSSKWLLQDPVRFWALMEYQYNFGEHPPEKVLEIMDAMSFPARVDSLEGLERLSKRLEFAENLIKCEAECRLYYYPCEAQNEILNIFFRFGVKTELVRMPVEYLCEGSQRHELPVAVTPIKILDYEGCGYTEGMYVLNVPRAKAIGRPEQPDLKYPNRCMMFNSAGEQAYLGKWGNLPACVKKYVPEISEAHIWELGKFDELLNKRTDFGEIVHQPSKTWLFKPEVEFLVKNGTHTLAFTGAPEFTLGSKAFISDGNAYVVRYAIYD